MEKKRLTQRLPWLLPIRKRQRVFCFYLKMALDVFRGIRYSAEKREELLPERLFCARSLLYNSETGFDMVYQENKVFNLKLAAAVLNKVVIRPHETFSFWKLVRYADRKTPFKDGLIVVDGELKTASGGGLCQMSNVLFWLFLHTPLTVVERHAHAVKHFPDPPNGLPAGVDAAVSEGWLDLKVRNDTEYTFQLLFVFDGEYLTGTVLTDLDSAAVYEVVNGELAYLRGGDGIFEEADVVRREISRETGACAGEKVLYRNRCRIGYELPAAE